MTTAKTQPFAGYGVVMGGALPVSGAAVQMYAVGSGYQAQSTPLFSGPLPTDANGKFNFSTAYTCPSSSALVYVVATGGNPGLAAGTNNPQISMMAVLGTCGSLTSTSAVTINEITTVAAVSALAPYMKSATEIGAATTDSAGIAAAFTLALQLADPVTGTTPGTNVPAGVTVPSAQIRTLANILSSCVDTVGGVAGDGSPCGKLLQLTTPPAGTVPTNVLGASLSIAKYPTQNVAQIYGLMPASPPFLPAPTGAPADFTVQPSTTAGLTVTPGSLNFSGVYAGAQSPRTITLTNTSASPITVSSMQVLGNWFYLQGSCGAIPAGSSCAVDILFATSLVGSYSAVLQITSNAPNSLVEIPLTGRTYAISSAPAFSVTPASLTFTQVGIPQTVTLSNDGDGELSTSMTAPIGPQETFTNNCPAPLPGHATCTITVQRNNAFPV